MVDRCNGRPVPRTLVQAICQTMSHGKPGSGGAVPRDFAAAPRAFAAGATDGGRLTARASVLTLPPSSHQRGKPCIALRAPNVQVVPCSPSASAPSEAPRPLSSQASGCGGRHDTLGNQSARVRQLQLFVRLSLPIQRVADARVLPGGRRYRDRQRPLRRHAARWLARLRDLPVARADP